MQEPAYKRLAIALCISALLHFFLVGNFYKLLPNHQSALHTIEARLQLAKTLNKPVETAKPAAVLPQEALPKPKKTVKTKPVIAPEPVTEPLPALEATPTAEQLPDENTAPPAESSHKPMLSESLASSGNSADIGEPVPTVVDTQNQPTDEDLVNVESAFQFVETTFNVSTKIGGSPEGTATMTYNLLDGTHYQINSVARARGLAALVLSELVQTSEGVLTKTGLQPNKFTYNYGDKASKSRLATFDWQAKTVSMQNAAGTQTEALQDDAQDLLSFMYQFMYVPPLHQMHINIVNGKSLRTFDYSFEGEELTSLPIGDVNTVHIQHSNTESEDKIDLWLAVNSQYLPVKIVKIDKNGKVIEFTAVNLKTTHVANPPVNY